MLKKRHAAKLLRRLKCRSGATLFEYCVVLVLVSIVAVAVLTSIGHVTNNNIAPVNNGLQ
jgi:Flp pilus assembly pilin Flp